MGYRKDRTLPLEKAALFMNDKKITQDISGLIRFELAKKTAERFLCNKRKDKWTHEQFEQVNWFNLHKVLENTPDMFKIWLSKQLTGFCGSKV